MSEEIIKVDAGEFGLTETKGIEIAEQFLPVSIEMANLRPHYLRIIELARTSLNEELCKEAKAIRNRYVKTRSMTSGIHKSEKSVYLNGGRFVDKFKKTQKEIADGIENELSTIENHFINLENERIELLQIERWNMLKDYMPEAPETIGLGVMDQNMFDSLLLGTKTNFEAAQAAHEAEKQRIADAEQAEKDRIIAVEKENEKLRKQKIADKKKRDIEDAKRISAERAEQKIRDDKAAAEKAKHEAILAAQLKESARKQKIESDKLEKERAENLKKLNAERAETARKQKIADDNAAKLKNELRLKEEEEQRKLDEIDAAKLADSKKGESEMFADFKSKIWAVLKEYDGKFKHPEYAISHNNLGNAATQYIK